MPPWKYFICAGLIMMPVPASAHLWEVGPTRDLKLPSEAAARARDGDEVRIDPGQYVDCAVWSADNLVIEGKGDVVIRDQVCLNKAIFVVSGSNITIRGITFAHARSFTRNGAGIRSEGTDLTVENSNFDDNENGILAGGNLRSHIVIRGSTFTRNGKCEDYCAHGIYIGQVASLQVFQSIFLRQYAGHHIKSRALSTEIIGNSIKDGPAGTASYAVDIPDGGSLILRGNIIEKGPETGNQLAVVTIGEESTRNPTEELTIEDNQVFNDNDAPTVFVRNRTAATARLAGNRMHGRIVSLAGPGSVSP